MAKTPQKNSQALGAYAGFSLQPTRMALLLLQASPDAVVSMELFEDVGVSQQGGFLASQTKGGWKGNPVSDKSPELWKTFANWVRDIRHKKLDSTVTIFEIYVNRKVTGKFVSQFSEAKTKQQAQSVAEAARQALWGTAPSFPNRQNVSTTLSPHLTEVFEKGYKRFCHILPRFQLTQPIVDPLGDLHNEVASWPTIKAEAVSDMVIHIHGWLKERVDEQTAKGQAPSIARRDLMQEIYTFYGKIVPSGHLPDLAAHPTKEDILALTAFPFVRQLEIIQLDSRSRDYAINCFFRAAATRTRWAENDLLHDDSIPELESNLEQAHRDYRTEVMAVSATSTEELVGQLLLARCNRHVCLVEGKHPPEYFLPGCFHSLANVKRLGWHPRFDSLVPN